MEAKHFKTALKYGSLTYQYNENKGKFVYLFTPYNYYTCNFTEINNTSLNIVINKVIKVIDFIENTMKQIRIKVSQINMIEEVVGNYPTEDKQIELNCLYSELLELRNKLPINKRIKK